MRKMLLAAAFASALTVAPAIAKDITLTLNDQEQQAFIQLVDQATRTGGLQVTQTTVYFYNKLQTAIAAAAEPPKAASNDAPKPEAPKAKVE
jgi:ABC-type sugar transport system substrate-binding protein